MSALHVAIDARELSGHVTGAGTYLLNLLRVWLPRDDVRIDLIVHRPLAPEVDALPGASRAARILRPDATGGTWWEQLVLPRAVATTGAEVLFSPAYTAPLAGGVPLVLTVHDVSFSAHPEWFRQPERFRRNFVTRRAARRAHTVITVSRFSAEEIARHLGVSPGRIRVIPHGAPPRRAEAGVARQPLIVFVGSIFNRRNIPDLITAFARLAAERPAARLLIAGANRTWPHQDIEALMARSGAADRITWAPEATNAQIGEALGRASAFAFLSEYEGFALTPLEALAAGVPSVLLDTAVAREVYGDAALYAPTGDIDAAAAALGSLLDSPAGRAAIVARGHALWDKYDWARAADETLAALRDAASPPRAGA